MSVHCKNHESITDFVLDFREAQVGMRKWHLLMREFGGTQRVLFVESRVLLLQMRKNPLLMRDFPGLMRSLCGLMRVISSAVQNAAVCDCDFEALVRFV
jgi:hypothetical protein